MLKDNHYSIASQTEKTERDAANVTRVDHVFIFKNGGDILYEGHASDDTRVAQERLHDYEEEYDLIDTIIFYQFEIERRDSFIRNNNIMANQTYNAVTQGGSVPWNGNRPVRLAAEQNWYDPLELNRWLVQTARANMSVIANRTAALDALNNLAHPLDYYNVNATTRFGEHQELVFENHGHFAREFMQLRGSLQSRSRTDNMAAGGHNDPAEKQRQNDVQYAGMNIYQEMMQQLDSGTELMNRERFESRFKLRFA